MDGNDMADAIDKVTELTKAGMRVELIAAQGEPAGHYYLMKPDGSATLTLAKPAWHNEKLATPADLREFIKEQANLEGAPLANHLLYYDDQRIIFVYEQDDRRDRATCDLRKSPQFAWLEGASKNPATLDQKSFIKTLRVLFRGCLGDSNLLALVRQLKFSNAAEGAGNIQHGRESIGRSISAAITGEAALPEDVYMQVPVFENHPFRARVACALEVMPQDQTFQLIPYPLEVQQAMDAALADVVNTLKGDNVPPAFRGSPN